MYELKDAKQGWFRGLRHKIRGNLTVLSHVMCRRTFKIPLLHKQWDHHQGLQRFKCREILTPPILSIYSNRVPTSGEHLAYSYQLDHFTTSACILPAFLSRCTGSHFRRVQPFWEAISLNLQDPWIYQLWKVIFWCSREVRQGTSNSAWEGRWIWLVSCYGACVLRKG